MTENKTTIDITPSNSGMFKVCINELNGLKSDIRKSNANYISLFHKGIFDEMFRVGLKLALYYEKTIKREELEEEE